MLLTDDEKRLLGGGKGRLVQTAMENIVRYATILGAEKLCRVTKATVFCGAHNYLNVISSKDPHEVFSRMNMGTQEVLLFDRTDSSCNTQSCVAPCDQYRFEPLGQSLEWFNKNKSFLSMANKAGVAVAGTCAPYLTGWIPVKGEHFVTTESGVTVLGNSLWGAMANADGIEAAFWSAICGRTPLWGMHLSENRHATHVVRVNCSVSALFDWDLLGAAIGKRIPTGGIPVVTGTLTGITFNKLRQFLTSLAVTSNCDLCHMAGITPEAPTLEIALAGKKPAGEIIIEPDHLSEAAAEVCDPGGGKVTLVSLGCPHYDIFQIQQVAYLLKGKTVHPDVHFMVWTAYPIKCMADENGYTRTIEKAGGHIYTSTCPTTIGKALLGKQEAVVFDSFKQAASVRSSFEGNIFTGGYKAAVSAAITGQWKKEWQWQNGF